MLFNNFPAEIQSSLGEPGFPHGSFIALKSVQSLPFWVSSMTSTSTQPQLHVVTIALVGHPWTHLHCRCSRLTIDAIRTSLVVNKNVQLNIVYILTQEAQVFTLSNGCAEILYCLLLEFFMKRVYLVARECPLDTAIGYTVGITHVTLTQFRCIFIGIDKLNLFD